MTRDDRTRRWMPGLVRDEIRLLRARLAHRGATYVLSPHVSPAARLAEGVRVEAEAVVGPGVVIGAHSHVNQGAIVKSGTIGKFVSIAYRAQIGGERHPVRALSTSSALYGEPNVTGATAGYEEYPDPPRIGSDVWIGAAAIVLQGVHVGDGAVVGAGAVVTRDVPPYGIVAGVPAKVIGERFPADVVAELLTDPWWERSPEQWARLGPVVDAGEEWLRPWREGGHGTSR
ncbi:DapH/DapD/GlmU-related protein [Kineococcus sp. SYSU DK001]|uniref:DapH/DapD/GlmU-related protein n=1 Tax=Kineococcus sp. SYSU DK001 TaxID=3383122 RepID=UPI003D7D30BA